MSEDWRAHAACKGHENPELWFHSRPNSAATKQAQKICGTCISKDACLAWAKSNGVSGVWGGEVIKSPRGRSLTAPYLETHGDMAGYYRHVYRKEKACGACLTAYYIDRDEREGRTA